MIVWCQECEKATGTRYFASKAAHDRHTKNPWNGHKITEVEDRKASWMLRCPVCWDAAASGPPERVTTKHPTVCLDENGDEIVSCSRCGTLYRFNLQWSFEKKELPKPEPVHTERVFLVKPYEASNETEVYRTPRAAGERIFEFECDALEAAGYVRNYDEAEDEDVVWESPFGKMLEHDEAVEEATTESSADMPEAPEEQVVLG